MSAVDAPDRPDRPDSSTERPAWRRRPISLGIAVLTVIVALICLVALLVHPRHATPTPAPRPAGPGAPQQVSDSACGLPGGDQTIPRDAPPDTVWTYPGGSTIAAPTSPTLGPGRHANGLPYCYAHSPLGALYAATGYLAASGDPALRIPANRVLTSPGPGRDALLDALAPGQVGAGGGGLQITGFAFLSYEPGQAAMNLLLTYNHVYLNWPVTVVWTGGDWKLLVPLLPDGHGQTAPTPISLQPVPDAGGYRPLAQGLR